MHLKELKTKSPAQLVEMAEELGVEGASTLRKQDLMFSILKELAEEGEEIIGSGTIEVLPDSFGFLRSSDANYLAGPDDIYVAPNMVRRFGLRGHESSTLEDVGLEIGLTRERVRQIQVEGLKRLREILEKNGLSSESLFQ